MEREISFSYDENKVIVSSQIIEKVKYLTKKKVVSTTLYEELTNEMNIKQFYKIIKYIMDIHICLPNKDNPIKYDIGLIYNLFDHLEQLRLRYHGKPGQMDEEQLNDLVDTVYKIKLEERNYNLMFDLIDAKNDCLASMKYFVSVEDISLFNSEYDKAIQTKDIHKMENMLKLGQQAILKQWDNYFDKIDLMNEDNFAFIGHSVRSCEFTGKFCSRYVSTSLFNQDLTDTYQEGYGFILAPKHIVGAYNHDMYACNDEQDPELLFTYSIISKIEHPQRLIDECLKLKRQNIENNNQKKVYSEILLDGFEPIGIFCFTDGSKNLNHNYREAKKLQERFPELKFYSFDVMKRKKGFELANMKRSLVNNLQKRCGYSCDSIDVNSLSRYDYFFEEFDKLKQTKNFDEAQIESIFHKNQKLLNSFYKEPSNVFDGRYNQNEIKYILGKNYAYNIDSILSGKARARNLNNLKQLYPYKDKLIDLYDGLSEFVDLISKVRVTDDMMIAINSSENINFYTIAKIIISHRMNSIDSQEEQSKQILGDYQCQYMDLYKELKEREKTQEQYDYYDSIYMHRFFAEKIKEDYKALVDDIKNHEDILAKLQTELTEITYGIASLENQMNYDKKNKGNVKRKTTIKRFNLFELFKHSIFYKLTKNKKANELVLKKNELETKKRFVEQDLDFVQSCHSKLYDQLDILNAKMNEYFKCDSVDEIDVALAKAEEFHQQYDNDNLGILRDLKIRLKELSDMILEHEDKLGRLLEEKEKIGISRKSS